MNISNYIDYYRSISIAKQLVRLKLLTKQEAAEIVEKLKKYYQIVDEHEITIL